MSKKDGFFENRNESCEVGKRGPVASGKKRTGVKKAAVSKSYFLPEAGTNAAVKKVWCKVVESWPVGYFRETDRSQLLAYCAAAVLLARAVKEMSRKDFEAVYRDNKGVKRDNPWLKVFKEARETVNSTGTKLRISKNSQVSHKKAGSAAVDAEIAQELENDNPWGGLLFEGERAN